MKKNILKATLVVAFALIAGMNVYNAQQSDIMSDLVLANVEALARNEISNCDNGCWEWKWVFVWSLVSWMERSTMID